MDQQPHTSNAGTAAKANARTLHTASLAVKHAYGYTPNMPSPAKTKTPAEKTSVKNNTRTQGTKRHQLPLGVVSRPNRQAPRLTAAQQGFALSASKQGSALSAAQQGFALSAKTLRKPGAVEAGCTSTSLRQPHLQYAGTRGMQQHLMHVKHMRTNRIKLLTS